jgi:sulfur carrier protein ThiS
MRIDYKLIPQGEKFKKLELKDSATGLALLEELNLAFDAHIITRNGDPIPLEEELVEGDKIGIIKVVSGG